MYRKGYNMSKVNVTATAAKKKDVKKPVEAEKAHAKRVAAGKKAAATRKRNLAAKAMAKKVADNTKTAQRNKILDEVETKKMEDVANKKADGFKGFDAKKMADDVMNNIDFEDIRIETPEKTTSSRVGEVAIGLAALAVIVASAYYAYEYFTGE